MAESTSSTATTSGTSRIVAIELRAKGTSMGFPLPGGDRALADARGPRERLAQQGLRTSASDIRRTRPVHRDSVGAAARPPWALIVPERRREFESQVRRASAPSQESR